jgi:uncharacterized protein
VIRLLFWIALVVLVVAALRSKASRVVQRQQPAQPPQPSGGAAESMACCAHCGIHFPQSEAVRADGLDYCCPAHVRLPPR